MRVGNGLPGWNCQFTSVRRCFQCWHLTCSAYRRPESRPSGRRRGVHRLPLEAHQPRPRWPAALPAPRRGKSVLCAARITADPEIPSPLDPSRHTEPTHSLLTDDTRHHCSPTWGRTRDAPTICPRRMVLERLWLKCPEIPDAILRAWPSGLRHELCYRAKERRLLMPPEVCIATPPEAWPGRALISSFRSGVRDRSADCSRRASSLERDQGSANRSPARALKTVLLLKSGDLAPVARGAQEQDPFWRATKLEERECDMRLAMADSC